MASGSLMAEASTLATSGTDGAEIVTWLKASLITSAAGCISAQ